jgi:hypothetical protein
MRSTNGIDIIVLLDGRAAEALPRVFPETQFYCPPSDVIEIERVANGTGILTRLITTLAGRQMCTSARAIRCIPGPCGTGGLSNIKVCKFG